MLEVLAMPFMQRALLALVLTGLTFPAVGLLILTLEMIPARFAVMHAALLGAAVALLLRVDVTLAAMVASLIAGAAIARMSEKGDISAGGYLGLVMTLTLGVAFIIFYKGNVHAIEAFNLFWGSVLALTDRDLATVVLMALALIAFLMILYKEIQVVLYDRELAEVVGVPAKWVYYALIVLVCLSVAVAMRVTGALLVDAVTILPAIAARQVGRSLKGALLWGALFGTITNLVGLGLAFAFDLPVSPAIIVVGASIVLLSRVAAPSIPNPKQASRRPASLS
jgi:zinc transport system permease protein